MVVWLATNAASLIVGGVVLIAIVFAVLHIRQRVKNGQCIGCDGCGKRSENLPCPGNTRGK